MSGSTLEERVRAVEGLGQQLGEKASHLSQMIEEICNRLVAINGKVECEVSEANGQLVLKFEKAKEWGVFVYLEDDPFEPGKPYSVLENAPLALKAKAFPLLIQLIDLIEQKQREQLAELDIAFESVPKGKSTNVEKEGK